jgi:hypothetical protein
MSRKVFLFDVDGVLVEPLGYRAVTRATLAHFMRRMGMPDAGLTDEVFDQFEANNISSEWDISALCLAAQIDAALAARPGLDLPGELSAACKRIGAAGVTVPPVDYAAVAGWLGDASQSGLTFAELGYRLSQPGVDVPLFPRLAGCPLLEALLAHSRDVRRSPVTRLFQELALGTKTFEETYGLAGEAHVDSYLRANDRPLLSPEIAAGLRREWEAGELHLAAYTVRPSSVKRGEAAAELPYAPEAELALSMVGLEGIPLVGYGQVHQVSGLTGLPADQIAKPSVIHALGAVGAAVTRDATQALLDAARWVTDPSEPGIYASFPPVEISVFEDSPWSIRAVQQAGELLTEAGIQARASGYGISRSPVKVVALIEAGAEIAPDVDTALRKALGPVV